MASEPARAQPLQIFTPVRRVWGLWLKLSWPPAERFPPVARFVKAPLKRLRFIHFAHWSLLTHMPPRGGRRLPYPYVVFSTTFNGDVNAYIDAFSILIPWRMRLLWQGAFHFPGPEPLGRFRRFITERVVPTEHFHCAYPQASVKMILGALELEEELDRLRREAPGLDDAEFARRWQQLLGRSGAAL
jgi:hypothetical protein